MNTPREDQKQYRCPACGFQIHNRAYPKCERCKKPLPVDLLLSKAEIDDGWKAMISARTADRKKKEEALRFRDTSSDTMFTP